MLKDLNLHVLCHRLALTDVTPRADFSVKLLWGTVTLRQGGETGVRILEIEHSPQNIAAGASPPCWGRQKRSSHTLPVRFDDDTVMMPVANRLQTGRKLDWVLDCAPIRGTGYLANRR